MIDLSDLGAVLEPEGASQPKVDLSDVGGRPVSERRIDMSGLDAEPVPMATALDVRPRSTTLPGPQYRTSPEPSSGERVPPRFDDEPVRWPSGEMAPMNPRSLKDSVKIGAQLITGVGKEIEAGLGDIASGVRGEGMPNTRQFLKTGWEQPLPIERAVEEAAKEPNSLAAVVPARISLGLAKSAPKIGMVMASGGAGASGLISEMGVAGGLFGLDDEGNFHTKEAVIGALLPGVGKVARVGVGALIGKSLASGIPLPTGHVAQKLMETVGEQAAMDAYMILADQLTQSQEQKDYFAQHPDELKAHLAETIGSNLAFALFGAGKFSKDVPSATKEWVLNNADSLATKKVIESYSAEQLKDIYQRVNASDPSATEGEKALVRMINSQLGKPGEAIKRGVDITEEGWPERLAKMLDVSDIVGGRKVVLRSEGAATVKPKGSSLRRTLPEKGEEENAPTIESPVAKAGGDKAVDIQTVPEGSAGVVQAPAGAGKAKSGKAASEGAKPAVIKLKSFAEFEAEDWAKATGWDFKPTGAVSTIGMPPELAARVPKVWEFTDRRADSPTASITFYVPVGSTKEQIETAYKQKVEAFENGKTVVKQPEAVPAPIKPAAKQAKPLTVSDVSTADISDIDALIDSATGTKVVEKPKERPSFALRFPVGSKVKWSDPGSLSPEQKVSGIVTGYKKDPTTRDMFAMVKAESGREDVVGDTNNIERIRDSKPKGASVKPKKAALTEAKYPRRVFGTAVYEKRPDGWYVVDIDNAEGKREWLIERPLPYKIPPDNYVYKAITDRLDKDLATEAAPKQPTVVGSAKSALDSAKEAAAESFKALDEFFGKGGRLGTGPSFDEQSYQKAKPHIKAAWEAFKKFGQSLKEFFDACIDRWGEGIKPYLKRFMRDLQEEAKAPVAEPKPDVGHALRVIIQSNESGQAKALKIRKLAHEDGMTIKQAQEQIEAEIVKIAQSIATDPNPSAKEKFDELVRMYAVQPTLSARTSTSVENQAYSTPAPLSFAGSYMLDVLPTEGIYDGTAGNGMLLIGGDLAKSGANEINPERLAALRALGVGTATENDATKFVPSQRYPVVKLNPPFGSIANVNYGGFGIKKLEHLIALKGLEAMHQNGRAMLILGANMRPSDKLVKGVQWVFENYLYSHYNVVSNFEVSGDLYAKQGAAWPVRVMIIVGRKYSPLPLAQIPKEGLGPKSVERFETWDDVWKQAEKVHDEVEQFRQTLGTGGTPGIPLPPSGGTTRTQRPGNLPAPTGGSAAPTTGGSQSGGSPAGKPAVGTRPAGGVPAAPAEQPPGRPEPAKPAAAQPNVGGKPNAPVEGERGRGADTPGDAGGTISGTGAGVKSGSVSRPPDVKGTEFQSPYIPRSEGEPFGTLTPKNIASGEAAALDALKEKVGPIDEYVANRLNMEVAEIQSVMAAEQIDGVALAIHQVESGGAIIIGDQTGIGKGRQAAAMIRYAKLNDMIPVFFTKDPKLFTDMYGDLKDINTLIKPAIFGDPAKSSIVDSTGGVIHRAPGSAGQKKMMQNIVENGLKEAGYDAIFITYSQVNMRNGRQLFLEQLANEPMMLILDEAHEAAGDGETSMQAAFMTGGQVKRGSGADQTVINVPGLLNARGTKQGQGGVTYLSATYAKRPENTPVYFRTSLSKAAQSFESIVAALKNGGVALQQAMSEALAGAGQYVRREREFTGVRYDMKRVEVADAGQLIDHVDQVTDVLSQIRDFSELIRGAVQGATSQSDSSVAMTDFASIVHNQVGQLLLAAKADEVVREAIEAHKRGEKPVIALMNTMESFLTHYVEDKGINPGDEMTLRWNELLKYALSRCLRVSEELPNGDTEIRYVNPDDYRLGHKFRQIEEAADGIESRFPISPIDYIVQKLNIAGVKMAELTGRESGLDYADFESGKAVYRHFKRANKNEVVNGFNGGKYDGMLLNASGSTGLSAHAATKFKDQKPRHMIIAQAALDINVFMQTLGRIFRTGLVTLGVYPDGSKYGARYTHVVLPLQAEIRPASIAAKKMKSLNANTTAEADNAIKIDSADIFNRYGDRIVSEYLDENPELQSLTGVDVETRQDGTVVVKRDVAQKFFGKMALLPDSTQKETYEAVLPAYRQMIEQLKATGEYDLEIVLHDDWDGLRKSDDHLKPGTDESNIFTASVRMQRWEVKDNRHVPTGAEMRKEFERNTGGAQKFGDAWRKFQADVDKAFGARRDYLRQRQSEVTKEEEKAQFEKALHLVDEIEQRWLNTQKQVHHLLWDGGTVIELSNAETGDRYDGMLVDLKFPKLPNATATPRVSPSAFKVKFMVDSPVGAVYATAAQFNPEKWAKDESSRTEADLTGGKKGARYERYFVVGNPIAGYDATGGRGKMVRFRSHDGQVVTGLLMPNNWGPANLANDPRLDLINGRAATEFLTRYTGVIECANIVRLKRATYGNHAYEITTSAAKRTGGDIFLDEKLRRLIGDFNKTGNKMVASVDEPNLGKAVDRLMEITKERFRPVGQATETLMPQVRDANDRAKRRQGSITPGASPSEGEPQRGSFKEYSIDQLRTALPDSGLSEEAQRFAKAFMDLPATSMLAPYAKIVVTEMMDEGWQGSSANDIATVIKNADPMVLPEELLHLLFKRFLNGSPIAEEFERMRRAGLDSLAREARDAGREDRAKLFEELRDHPLYTQEFIERNYPPDMEEQLYDYSNADEFFAKSANRRFQQRVGSIQPGFWERVRAIIAQFIAAIRRALRLKPTQEEMLDRVLDGKFEPSTAQQRVSAKQGSLKPRETADLEREGLLPTKVFGEEYYVLDREQINPQSIAASSALAKSVLDECKIPAMEMPLVDETTGRERVAWVMTPQGYDMSEPGRQLLDRLKQQIGQGAPGKASQELANLLNSIVINFEMGTTSAMAEMSPDVRNELWAVAQSDRSARGIALQALAGYAKDLKFVGRNMDVELGRIWSDTFGGDELRRLLDELKAARAALEASQKRVAELEAAGYGKGGLGKSDADLERENAELRKAKEALEKANAELTAALEASLKKKGRKGLRKAIKQGPKLNQRILDAIKEGGDAWDVLKELALANRWKVPTDAELSRIKGWVEEWEKLERLSVDELTRAGTDKRAREAALREKLAVTEKRRIDLRKQIETSWTRFTRPFTLKTATGRVNVTNAIGEFVSANLLLKVGFATRQTVDVLTQGALYTPTRAIQHAIGIHQKEIEAGRRSKTDMTALIADAGDSLKEAYQQRVKALRNTLLTVGEVLRGHEQGRHVARLMGRVSIFDRAMQRADEMRVQGKTGEAFLLRAFTLMRLGYRIAQAMDNLHGQPAVEQEMRQQMTAALRENGMTRAEADQKADWVMGDLKAEQARALPDAEAQLLASGVTADEREVRAAAWRLVRARQYQRMRELNLAADDFEGRNLELMDTLGWSEAEEGGVGGLISGVMRGGNKLAGQIAGASRLGVPLAVPLISLTRFGNAIGILINRKLSFTPLGFFPGAFGVMEADIDPETGIASRGSPWFRTEEDRRQRKVEATVGTMFSIAFGMLAATGAIIVRLTWPKDKEERQLWDRLGWRPGQVSVPTGDGKHIILSMNTGPMVVFSPGLSAGGALHDLLEDRANRQARMDIEAAKLGLTPGKIQPVSTADLMGVAGSAAWGSVVSGRTLSGLLGGVSEFGTFHPVKAAASTFSSLTPGLPGLQELDRMAFGTVLDSKMASVWDFMMPLPTSGAAQTNMLGDPVGEANALQRVVQTLTGGNYPFPVSDKERQSEAAYRVLFESGYRPPLIDPGKFYAIGNDFRPFTQAELQKYTEMRGKLFKDGLTYVDPSDKAGAKQAFQQANEMAINALGANTPTRESAGASGRPISQLGASGRGISRRSGVKSPSRTGVATRGRSIGLGRLPSSIGRRGAPKTSARTLGKKTPSIRSGGARGPRTLGIGR